LEDIDGVLAEPSGKQAPKESAPGTKVAAAATSCDRKRKNSDVGAAANKKVTIVEVIPNLMSEQSN
jgi:hypothetical protein